MEVPSRTEAVAILEEGHAGLRNLLGRLSSEESIEHGAIGDGDWSAKDLIGHVATWEEIALDSISAWRTGQRPWFDDPAYQGEEGIDRLNAFTVEHKRATTLEEVRSAAEATHRALIHAIDEATEEEWVSPGPVWPGDGRSLGALAGGRTEGRDGYFRHAFDHLPDLASYLSSLRS